MALVLEQIHTPGIAQLSYLVGDDDAGVAAVIDPRRDVDVYVELASARGLRIEYAVETHIHADFVSGAQELRARTGARIVGGRSDEYRFDLQTLGDGETLTLGGVALTALHTPGHTPEHVSLLLSSDAEGEGPFAVLTGDTLLNRSVGRPDLVGEGLERRLAASLHASIFERLLPLGDGVELLPGHTAGSACATSIGHRLRSTLGSERRRSPMLRHTEPEAFVDALLANLPEPPRHYPRLKKANAAGTPVLGGPPYARPLTAAELRARSGRDGTLLIDLRPILAFGGGHVPGALHLALDRYFPTWVGWMVDPEIELLLVADEVDAVHAAILHLYRLGYDQIGGYLAGGMKAWQNAGFPLARIGEWTVHELNERRTDPEVTVLDVRSPFEWREGRVPGARHIHLPELEARLGELHRGGTIATYCGSGYRASLAASVLRRHGFERVANVPGSMKAWRAAGLPLER